METNRGVPTSTRRRRPLWILCCVVVSIPLAAILEAVTEYSSPGVIVQSYLFPSRGHGDMTRFLVLAFVLDAIFCFALLLGGYSLFVKLHNGRESDPS